MSESVLEPVRSPDVDRWLAALTRPEGREDPYPVYESLRSVSPVALAEDGAIVLTRYADCHQVLHDHALGRPDPDEFLTSIGLTNWRDLPALLTLNTSMLLRNPPEHTRLRRLVSKSFTARRVEQLSASVAGLVDRLLDDLEGGGDFIEKFAFPLPVRVIGELLGVPEEDQAQFQPLVRDWTMILDVFDFDVLARANEAATQLRSYLGDLVAERRRHPQDDLISALVTQRAEGEAALTDEELVTMAALLFSAGFETTTHLLGNGLVALLDHPDQAEALRQNPDLSGRAVEELVRYDSSVHITNRLALEDTTVGGVPVPAGSNLVCYVGAANRDPAKFADPDVLKLDRQEGGPMSFGGGIHYCLGAPLARLEAQLAFSKLLRRYPELEISGPGVRRDSLTLRGYLSLPVSC
ncbi:MAG TPA: cytochrome P450 [Nocardioidaceae bacterium]|nr:cytochrome P450 [Nocardioidaceae bacterium]